MLHRTFKRRVHNNIYRISEREISTELCIGQKKSAGSFIQDSIVDIKSRGKFNVTKFARWTRGNVILCMLFDLLTSFLMLSFMANFSPKVTQYFFSNEPSKINAEDSTAQI